jgi:hypothetical protein
MTLDESRIIINVDIPSALVGGGIALAGSGFTLLGNELVGRRREHREDARRQRDAKAGRLRSAYSQMLKIAAEYELAAHQVDVWEKHRSPEQKAAALRQMRKPLSDEALKDLAGDLELEVDQDDMSDRIAQFMEAVVEFHTGIAAAAESTDAAAIHWEQDGGRIRELAAQIRAHARQQLGVLERPI